MMDTLKLPPMDRLRALVLADLDRQLTKEANAEYNRDHRDPWARGYYKGVMTAQTRLRAALDELGVPYDR